MTVIQNTATDPGGNPLAGTGVRIALVTGAANGAGYTASGDIIGTYATSTDQAGHWSATLTPNASITPANTYYQVVEGRSISNIVVPSSGGPYLLANVLAVPPPTPSAPGITGLQIAANGAIAGVRPELNLIAGANTSVTAADNAGSNRVDITLAATGGVALDTVGADLKPVGAPAAGTTGLAADAGHVHPYHPWQFYVGAYGAKGDDSTDDTASIRNAIAAAFNYAHAGNGYAEILFDPLTYLLSSAPITGATFNGATFQGSAQLPIPAQAETAQHLVLAFVGTRDQTALYHWHQTTPQRAGTVLRSTYAAGATIPATGEASVLGGPTPHYMGDPPSTWSNVHVVIDGVSIEVPTNPQICGFDFRCIGSANVKNAGVLALSAGTGAPQIPDPNWAFGLAMPVAGNNDNCNVGWYSCEGLVYGLIVYEHVQADSVRLINCFDGLVCWSSSGFPHRNHVSYASIENCTACIVLAGSFNKLDIDVADLEWGTGHIVNDAAATPGIGHLGLCANGATGDTLSAALSTGATAVNVGGGALALDIENLDQRIGAVTAPTVPASGTPLTNPFWRQAEVTVTGGTVTQIAVDGANRLVTSGTVTVPAGRTVTLTYSVAPTWSWTVVK